MKDMRRRQVGLLGERIARQFLEERGYRVRQANYRCPAGEADIVAEHAGCLVFVEVRTKRGRQFGSPEESITPAKMRRMRAVAAYYQQAHDNLPEACRIDVVAVELGGGNRPSRIEVIENAVGED